MRFFTGSLLLYSVVGQALITVEPSKLSEAWGSFTSAVFTVTSGAHTLAFTIGEGEGMDLIDNVMIRYCK